MEFLPLFHKLQGSHVLVVGGGEIALRKSRLLVDAGALIRVVAPAVESQLQALVDASGGEVRLRGYAEADLEGCQLIIAATDDQALNAQVSDDAKRRCVPVNVVDTTAVLLIKPLLQQTDALNVMPIAVAQYYESQGVLKILPIELPCRMDAYGIITVDGHIMSPGATLLLKSVREVARELL